MNDPVPEPSELVYPPGASWAPVLLGGALALLVVGAFTAWWWSAIGLVVALGALRSWWKRTDDEVASMRRSQVPDTAVLPAEPIKRR